MNLALLMLLALMWAVVLLPSALRRRRHNLRHSVSGFHRAMDVLSGHERRGDSRMVLVPHDAARIVRPPTGPELARQRRRRVLAALASTVLVSSVLAVAVGGIFTALALVSAPALGAYVGALRNLAVRAEQARRLVQLDERRLDGAHHADTTRRAVGI